jgi:hypothetical protein
MRHLVIPDVQAKPGVNFEYLTAIGEYIVDKRPEKIICLGDFADMPSLSSYDVGKKAYEGRRYLADIISAQAAMRQLLHPLIALQGRQKLNKKQVYSPELVMLLGNHENRINRAVNNDPKLDGLISTNDLQYEAWGWEVHPFLERVIVDDIAYSHYFVTGVAGRPAVSAQAQLNKQHMSCIAGHQQGLQIHTGYKADGTILTSIIAGSCYEHDEDYMGPQGNHHWRGVLMLNDVHNGGFEPMPITLKYLKDKYGVK